jgi:hypothetical protein
MRVTLSQALAVSLLQEHPITSPVGAGAGLRRERSAERCRVWGVGEKKPAPTTFLV